MNKNLKTNMNRYRTATNSNFYQSSSTVPENGNISSKPLNSDSTFTSHNATGNFQNITGPNNKEKSD